MIKLAESPEIYICSAMLPPCSCMARIFLGKGDVSSKDIGCKTSVGGVLVSVGGVLVSALLL